MATEEEKAANAQVNEEFEIAMKKWIEHYYGAEDGLIMDYILIVEQQTFDEEGDAQFTVKWKARKGTPSHRSLGLLEAMSTRIRSRIAGAGYSKR